MHTQSRLRPSVVASKERLAESRARLKQQHDQGTPGIQVCAHLTDMLDSVVLDVFEAALTDVAERVRPNLREHVSLVATGGYGRCDVAPYSDVDLMLLHRPAVHSHVEPLARRIVTDLSDLGFKLGFSVRTPADACHLAVNDFVVLTSLIECRFLAGASRPFSQFTARFRRLIRRRVRRLIHASQKARSEERTQFGATVYLLEPNVKRSPGGLRDIHLSRWVGFLRYGERGIDAWRQIGVISSQDQTRLRKAHEFLLRLRNELHFHAQRAQDVLNKSEQLRLAKLGGFPGDSAVLPVEQFMQQYFQHTSEILNVVSNFVSGAVPRSGVVSLMAPFLTHRIGRDFRVGPVHISATRTGQKRLRGDVGEILHLLDLANLYDKWIETNTWDMIRKTMEECPQFDLTPTTVQRFLSILSRPARLGDILRRLHQMRVLEKILPGLGRSRCLLQFNDYHKFTVDEHCIRAVECATGFQHHDGPLGQAYRSLRNKSILHLALLIHDLGKGHVEDHSEVGKRLAEETAERLGLSERESEQLVFLVHRHLRMSYLAFRRDTSDDSVITQFAKEVGTPDLLKMMFVLTCADLDAVGPGVLNQWKSYVLTELYVRSMRRLAGDTQADADDDQLEEKRQRLHSLAQDQEQKDWLNRQIDVLPPTYLRWTTTFEVMDELQRMYRLKENQVDAWARYLPDHNAVQYTVGTYEQITSGIFHKLTGALTSRRLQILAADIYTLQHGLVLDRFFVHDPDFTSEPPPYRLNDIRQAMIQSLTVSDGAPPIFRRTWQAEPLSDNNGPDPMPTRVTIDNNTSDRHTIIDVFAHDRMGLLYAISRALFRLGLPVSTAKIGTYTDQIVDVFYVTDQAGRKIEDPARIRQVKSQLLTAIQEEQQEPRD